MEFLRLSKFKLQLRTLISELRELRERERSAKEQLHHRIQKQKQSEEEYGRKIQELQEELSSSHEQRQKLEKKLNYLQNDNVLLENKQKELKETIQELVLSKEHFVNSYEESTYDMKRSIEIRDRKISVLSEKMKSHLLLFDSIEKEAFSVKHVVDNVQQVLSEKEEIAATLKSKLDAVSAFEKTFVEKICDLEKKLRYNEDEIQRKNNVISELEVQLEAAKIRTASQTHIDELQKSLWEKDAVIKNLTLKNETLYFELESLGTIFKKIRDILANMTVEDKRRFSPILECQGVEMVSTKEDNRIEDVNQSSRKYSSAAFGTGATQSTASPLSLKSVAIHSRGNNNVELCVSESASSKTQSAANDPSISVNDENV